MSRFTPNTPARRTGRTRARLAAGLTASALAATAVLGQAGCQTAETRGPTASPQSPKTAFMPHPRGGEAPVAKTNFKSQATPSQGYNVHLELGRAMESQGNYEAAVTEYQKAIDVAANRGSAQGGAKLTPGQLALGERRLAAALDRMGKFTQAEGHYRKALTLAPEDPKVWNNCGYSYYLQCRYDDAERALKTADKFDPGDPLILTNLGLAQAANGKVEAGLANLTRASGPAVAHANLAYVLASTGKQEDARAHYQKALELQPDLVVAREAAARLDAQLAKAGARPTPVSVAAVTPSPNAPRTPTPSGDPAVAVTSASAAPAAPRTAAPTPLPPLPEGFDTPAQSVGETKPISVAQPVASKSLVPASRPVVSPAPPAAQDLRPSEPTPLPVQQAPESGAAADARASDREFARTWLTGTTAPTPAAVPAASPQNRDGAVARASAVVPVPPARKTAVSLTAGLAKGQPNNPVSQSAR